MALERELEVARRLALEAGQEVMALRGKAKVSAKAKGEPVTAADLAANEIILKGLAVAYPADSILSEEHPLDSGRLTAERVWVIDPIDGTREYIEGTADFAVQIGLAVKGRAVLGLVFQCAKQRLFRAVEGSGAWLEDPADPASLHRIAVSREADPHRMRLTLSRWHRSKKHLALSEVVGPASLLPAGSVGVKLCLIANGEAELYLHPTRGTAEWDTCAPDVILREAGGAITNLFGEPLRYDRDPPYHPNGVAASNGQAHSAILDSIEPTVREFGFTPQVT